MLKMLNKLRLKTLLLPVFVSIALFYLFFTPVVAEEVEIPKAFDLQQDGITAREKGIPVLLEFTMHGCPFCEEVEDEVLRPMLISGDYDNKVIVRNIKIDEEEREIVDFNGKLVTHEELTSRYSVFVAPTLVLVDGHGKAMGLDMVGVTTIDYYGIYLDQAIDQAKQKISTTVEKSTNAGSPAS